jgi:hypothetical protein
MTATLSVDALLSRAKASIAGYYNGVNSLRSAAEDVAAAQARGATQTHIAATLGKSQPWVNRLLQWRTGGYQDTAFGPESKAKRERSANYQSPDKSSAKPKPSSEARFNAEAAKAEAAKAKAEAAKAKAEAAKARSENARARADAKRAQHEAFAEMFGRRERKVMDAKARDVLVKALGMLGSDSDGEVLNAARVAEKQRRKLGFTWDDIIVAASSARAAA